VRQLPSLGHVLVAGAGRRLGDGNRIGSRKRILKPAIEALVESLLAPLLASSPLVGSIQIVERKILMIRLHRPLSIPMIRDVSARISIFIHETASIEYALRRPFVPSVGNIIDLCGIDGRGKHACDGRGSA
jgi:hypothetical protein